MANKFGNRVLSFLDGFNTQLQTTRQAANPVTIGNANVTNSGSPDNSKWLIGLFLIGGFFLISKFFK